MSLTEKYGSSLTLFFSFSSKKPAGSAAAASSKPFEENLIPRLRSLLPIPDSTSSIPLSWLSHAVDLLTLTHADATAVISDLSLSGTDCDALSSYLDSSVALLDACNAISAAADRLLRGRLLIRLALHLISSSPTLCPNHRLRSRAAIAEWQAAAAETRRGSACGFLLRLRPKDPHRGRLSAVFRAVYAVEAISDLVATAALASLGEIKDFLPGIRVSSEFPWATPYNEVVAAVLAKLRCVTVAGDIEAEAAASVTKLAAALDEEDGGEEMMEKLRNAVSGAEEAAGELSDGLDRLSSAVDGLFRAALEMRDAALQCFRIGPQKCK